VDSVNVGFEQTLHRTHAGVDTRWDTAENTSDNEAITRLGNIHKLVVYTERHGMWCLAVGYSIWGLLKTNHLPVGKLASVVDERHCPDGSANFSTTTSGLFDLAPVDFNLHSMLASEAAEESHLHIGNNGSGSNNEPFDADQFVGI
jgi:hypothetical protein